MRHTLLHSESQPEHILDKQISHRQDQPDTKQQQPEGHASGDHHRIFAPLLMHQRQLMFVVALFRVFAAQKQIAEALEEGGGAGGKMCK